MQPSVFTYLDVPDFLNSYYLYRKSQSKSFSYEKWARELGYLHRSNLRLVVKGERSPSVELEQLLCQSLFSMAQEKKYFKILCQIRKETSEAKKLSLFEKCRQIQNQKEVRLGQTAKDYEILDSLYLNVLLGFKDLDKTAKGLARYLRQSPDEVESSLVKLEGLGVARRIKKEKKTVWERTGQYSIFADDWNNEKLANFHRQSFKKAIESQNLPKNQRHFDSLILSLKPQEYQAALKDIQEFLDTLYYKYNKDEIAQRHLYHIQIGSFRALKEG